MRLLLGGPGGGKGGGSLGENRPIAGCKPWRQRHFLAKNSQSPLSSCRRRSQAIRGNGGIPRSCPCWNPYRFGGILHRKPCCLPGIAAQNPLMMPTILPSPKAWRPISGPPTAAWQTMWRRCSRGKVSGVVVHRKLIWNISAMKRHPTVCRDSPFGPFPCTIALVLTQSGIP